MFFERTSLPTRYFPRNLQECLDSVVGPSLTHMHQEFNETPTASMDDDLAEATPVNMSAIAEHPVASGEPSTSGQTASSSRPGKRSAGGSIKNHNKRTPVSGTKSVKSSSNSTSFMETFPETRPIVFTLGEKDTIDELLHVLEQSLSTSTTPLFLHEYQQAVLHSEAHQCTLTAKGKVRFQADPDLLYTTYKERFETLQRDDVYLNRLAGGEVAKTAAMRYGLYHLANMFVQCEENFQDPDSVTVGNFDMAELIKYGITDIQTHSISSPPAPGFVTSLVEDKPTLTRGDIVRLYCAMRTGSLRIFWDKETGKMGCSSDRIGAATKEILSQLVKEAHANKSPLVILGNFDCYVPFFAKSGNEFEVLPMVLRDPEDRSWFSTDNVKQAIHQLDHRNRSRMFAQKISNDFNTKYIHDCSLLLRFLVALLIDQESLQQCITWEDILAMKAIKTSGAKRTSSVPPTDEAAPSGPAPGDEAGSQNQATATPGGDPKTLVFSMATGLSLAQPRQYDPEEYTITGLDGIWVPILQGQRGYKGSMESVSSSVPSLSHSAGTDPSNNQLPLTPEKVNSSEPSHSSSTFDNPDATDGRMLNRGQWNESRPLDDKALAQLGLPTRSGLFGASSFTDEGPITVELVQRLDSGRVYDPFRGFLRSDLTSKPCPIIAKFVNLADCQTRHFDTRYDRTLAEKSVYNEILIYKRFLRNLQIKMVVPRFYGVWQSGDMLVMVLEDVGDMSNSQTQNTFVASDLDEIRDLYRQLHKAGVIHGDVQARHCIKGPDNKVRLIDFEGSYYAGDEPAPKRHEMILVDKLIVELRFELRGY